MHITHLMGPIDNIGLCGEKMTPYPLGSPTKFCDACRILVRLSHDHKYTDYEETICFRIEQSRELLKMFPKPSVTVALDKPPVEETNIKKGTVLVLDISSQEEVKMYLRNIIANQTAIMKALGCK